MALMDREGNKLAKKSLLDKEDIVEANGQSPVTL